MAGICAFQAAAVEIRLPAVTSPANTVVDVPVSLGSVTDLYGFSFTISFPSAQLEYVAIAEGTLTRSIASPGTPWDTPLTHLDTATSMLSVAASGSSAINGSGPIAWLKFKVKAGVALNTTCLLQIVQADLNDGGLPVSKVNGSIKVGPSNTPTVNVLPAPRSVEKGLTTSVPVNVTGLVNVKSMYVEIAYDSSLFTFESASSGSLNPGSAVSENKTKKDKAIAVWAWDGNLNGISGSGSVLNLQFTAKAGTKFGATSPLIVERAELDDVDGLVNVQSGSLVAGPCWTNFAYTGTPELGSSSQPYNTIGEANAGCVSGATIRIQYSPIDFATNETPRLGAGYKALRIESAGGVVRIGDLDGKRSAQGRSPRTGDHVDTSVSPVVLVAAGGTSVSGLAIEGMSVATPSELATTNSVITPILEAEVPPADAPLRGWLTVVAIAAVAWSVHRRIRT